jgi:hypothetical protein
MEQLQYAFAYKSHSRFYLKIKKHVCTTTILVLYITLLAVLQVYFLCGKIIKDLYSE